MTMSYALFILLFVLLPGGFIALCAIRDANKRRLEEVAKAFSAQKTAAPVATPADPKPKRGPGRPRKNPAAPAPAQKSDATEPVEFAAPISDREDGEPRTMEPDEFAAFFRARMTQTQGLRDVRLQASCPSLCGGYTVFGSCSVSVDPANFHPDARFVLDHFDLAYYVVNRLHPRDTLIDLFGPDGLHATIPMGSVYDAAQS